MQNIYSIPAKELAPGFFSHLVHGSSMTFQMVEIKNGSVLPQHHHVHEQITFIAEGELEMTIGGETMLMKAGSVHVIPSNVPHSAIARTDCKVIDAFNPVREDYK